MAVEWTEITDDEDRRLNQQRWASSDGRTLAVPNGWLRIENGTLDIEVHRDSEQAARDALATFQDAWRQC